ncbi:MAG: riboflavin synthase [Deltaproteobacteria bacterium]|nr:riboflavin synthase [Deltaproteobacteria bacterium]
MFTGLIEEVGSISRLRQTGGGGMVITVGCEIIQGDLKTGDSVCIDGICLTVVRFSAHSIEAELSPETLKTSLFSIKTKGQRVNLERALTLNGRLGGHLVLGHVDAISQVKSIDSSEEFHRLGFSIAPEIKPYIVHKGSVALNGISLTVASVTNDEFQVAVIPHSFKNTNLADLKPGDKLHLETDIIARYVEGLLPHMDKPKLSSPIDLDFIRKHGFDH